MPLSMLGLAWVGSYGLLVLRPGFFWNHVHVQFGNLGEVFLFAVMFLLLSMASATCPVND